MVCAWLMACMLAQEPTPQRLELSPESTLTYKAVHKFHTVEGIAKGFVGMAKLTPGGDIQLMVRAQVATFDSGNANRDAHMQEVVEAGKFPLVEVKAVGSLGSCEATCRIPIKGRLTFHGVESPIDTMVDVKRLPSGGAATEVSISLSLDAHKVERPALLFVKLDDALTIVGHLVWTPVVP